jgi:hypothetical protein
MKYCGIHEYHRPKTHGVAATTDAAKTANAT